MVIFMKKWVIFFFFCWCIIGCMHTPTILNFEGKDKEELEEYVSDYHIKIEVEEVYSEKKVGTILKQVPKNGKIQKTEKIKIVVSKGIDYEALKVNELGNVPIMMYHGIWNMSDDDTEYTKGNVDKDGYQRTSESFRRDLEFYYKEGYRMIRLSDFVEGKIDVELGKSPIVITFDDGKHNISVSKSEQGELIIDPNSAVGILEEFKNKYPDFKVTATFFLNANLFESEYNEEIIKWLIEHGYDIGNHSADHVDFTKVSEEEASMQIGKMYSIFDTVVPKRYVSIVALPFGSPYSKEHVNFPYILNSSYNGKIYHTNATLRVGWEANLSPFSNEFDSTFLKRIRAYDNNGSDFDIEMNFSILSKTRFISDGNPDIITIPNNLKSNVGKTTLKVNTY